MTVIDTNTSELAQHIDSGLPPEKINPILAVFVPFFDEARPLCEEALGIKVEDAADITGMKEAKNLRLKLKAIRVACEKQRKEEKSDALKIGQTVDKVAGVPRKMIEEAEAHLKEQEEYAIRAEAERQKKLSEARLRMLEEYDADTTGVDLGRMKPEAWEVYFGGIKSAHKNRIEAERKAEAERIEREAAEAERVRKIEEQNAKLKAEAEAKAKEAAVERERLQAIASKERAEREAAEAALQKKQKEDATKAKSEEEARLKKLKEEKRAAQAPDREKFAKYAERVMQEAENMPVFDDDEIRISAQTLCDDIIELCQDAGEKVQGDSE